MVFDLSKLLSIKDIYGLIKKGATLEAQEEIMKYREAIQELTDENFQLKQELLKLKQQQFEAQEIVFKDGVYYRHDEQGREDGPFCPKCYDADKKLIRLLNGSYNPGHSTYCPVCRGYYG